MNDMQNETKAKVAKHDYIMTSGLLGSQRGTALVMAIGLMAIMGLLATLLMSLTTSEIRLSANYRDAKQAFLVADRAIEYAITGAAISTGNVDLYTDTDKSGTLHRTNIGGPGALDPNGVNSADYIGSGTPPVGSGSDASKFKALNYVVSATGIFPASSNNPSRAVVRAQVAKVVPK